MKLRIHYALLLLLCASCGGPSDSDNAGNSLESLANEYLFLELSMGQHDPAHVDAYFGPPEIAAAAKEEALSLDQILERSLTLIRQLSARQESEEDPLTLARVTTLAHRVGALTTRIGLNQGKTLPFDEESRNLFGAAAPNHDDEHFAAILAELDALIPGDGPLTERVNAFRAEFFIPPDRYAEVFDAAIAECRRRTLEYIDLPEDESFSLEFVTDKPWSGYNWYQGNSHSLIQLNTDLPTSIDRAVDLGCHEGYPGHHTFNALLEKHLVNDAGWQEFSLYPLFSPQSLIAEGSGNYGIELAFPGDERIRFEKEVLFPLAGLDVSKADQYYAMEALMAKLNYAGNKAARDYLDGNITREEAIAWLTEYALSSPERAAQRVDFFDTYRSYVINYNLGKDLVADYVERDNADQDERWRRFTEMLSTPMLPEDLIETR